MSSYFDKRELIPSLSPQTLLLSKTVEAYTELISIGPEFILRSTTTENGLVQYRQLLKLHEANHYWAGGGTGRFSQISSM